MNSRSEGTRVQRHLRAERRTGEVSRERKRRIAETDRLEELRSPLAREQMHNTGVDAKCSAGVAGDRSG